MTSYAVIGKNFDTTWKYINDSSKSEFFVPDANDQMDCDTLKRNYDTLTSQINMWNEKILNSQKPKELENLGKIIENQSRKQGDYESMIARKCTPAGNQGDQTTTTTATTTGGNNSMIWIAGAALIMILLFKK